MLYIVNSNGVPSIAPIVQVTPAPADTQAPSAPGTLAASGSTGSATLNWALATDNVAVTAYNVYRSTTSGFTPSAANKIGQTSGTTYTDANVPAGTYYYLVAARLRP